MTIVVGENGTGKSTLIEAIAVLAGYPRTGGGKGYVGAAGDAPRDGTVEALAGALRAAWLPKVTRGWFFRADTFFGVAQYLEEAYAGNDYLSYSHGEGFLRFFGERLGEQGISFLDEPESALSPRRQVELMALLAEVQQTGRAQVVMATHSPLLMAVPGAALWRLHHRGIRAVDVRETEHFRLYQSFAVDPDDFVARALAGDWDGIV